MLRPPTHTLSARARAYPTAPQGLGLSRAAARQDTTAPEQLAAMDLGDLANTVQDCGLSQTIKTGLNKTLMKPPAWGTPEEEEAKKGELKGCNAWKVYNTAMGAACMNAWATKDNVVLGS